MSQQYLLSCSCGKAVAVSVAQAGSKVTCQCGTTLEVPKLRELRLLKTAGEREPLRAEPIGATPGRVLFATCLILGFSASIVAALAGFQRWQMGTVRSGEEISEKVFERIDNLTPIEVVIEWMSMVKSGPNSPELGEWYSVRSMYESLTVAMKWSAMIAGLAFVAALVAAIATRKRKTAKA